MGCQFERRGRSAQEGGRLLRRKKRIAYEHAVPPFNFVRRFADALVKDARERLHFVRAERQVNQTGVYCLAAPMGRTRKLRRSGSGRGGGNSGEESVKFEAKPPEQTPGFDDLNETKYGRKQEKLSKLGLRAGELKEIEADPDLAGLLDVRIAAPS